MEYLPRQLLEMDEAEIGRWIEVTWNETKELQERTSGTNKRYSIACSIIVVAGLAAWFLGVPDIFVFALFNFAALIKIYGEIKVAHLGLRIVQNNQYVSHLTAGGIAKRLLVQASK